MGLVPPASSPAGCNSWAPTVPCVAHAVLRWSAFSSATPEWNRAWPCVQEDRLGRQGAQPRTVRVTSRQPRYIRQRSCKEEQVKSCCIPLISGCQPRRKEQRRSPAAAHYFLPSAPGAVPNGIQQQPVLARHGLAPRRKTRTACVLWPYSPPPTAARPEKKRRGACGAHASRACSTRTSCDNPRGNCYRPCTSPRRPCWHAGSLRSGRLRRFLGPAVRLLPRSPDTYRHRRTRSSDPG